MINRKNCYCLYAVIAAIAAILLVTYIWGYSLGSWNVATWIAAGVIILTILGCSWCKLKSDEE